MLFSVISSEEGVQDYGFHRNDSQGSVVEVVRTFENMYEFFDRKRYLLYCFVVMKDRVHVIIQPGSY